MVRGGRPLRAYCEVRAHVVPVGFGVATPTAQHLRSPRVSDEIEIPGQRSARLSLLCRLHVWLFFLIYDATGNFFE
jgi:hypothetical protein